MGDRLHAVDLHNQAVQSMQSKPDQSGLDFAYKMFNSSAMADPTFAEAWRNVGNSNGDRNLLPGAVAAYRRVMELPLEDVPGGMTQDTKTKVMVNLGHRLHHLGQNEEAREWINKVIKLDPSLAVAWMNLSLIQGTDGELDEAVESGLKAFTMDPTASIETALAFAYLFKGDYAKGLEHFEARFPYTLKHFMDYPYPKWRGEPGKTVFLVADQGLGDTLSFSRFVELASQRAKYINMGVQQEFRKLFVAAFQHLKNINVIPIPCPFPPADVWTTFMSLPYALGLTTEEISSQKHINVPDFRMPTHWKSTDRKLHIGISWGGSPGNFIDKWRSIPVEMFLELYRVPGIQLYSLQIGDRSVELHNAGLASLIRDMQPYIRDVSDSIAIVKELDLIISIESFLPHIGGLLEKEVWIPYSYHGRDWRIGYDGKNPLWYKRHQIFKQGKDATWGPVFKTIIERLRGRV